MVCGKMLDLKSCSKPFPPLLHATHFDSFVVSPSRGALNPLRKRRPLLLRGRSRRRQQVQESEFYSDVMVAPGHFEIGDATEIIRIAEKEEEEEEEETGMQHTHTHTQKKDRSVSVRKRPRWKRRRKKTMPNGGESG